MIEGKNFIFTGLQPWDISIGSNAKDIAQEVAKQNKVLYINTPLDKKTCNNQDDSPEFIQRKNVIFGKSPVLRQINPNLWILDYPFTVWPVSFLPDGPIFDWVNKINNKRMYSFVQKILKQLHFDKYILFIDNDIYRSFYAREMLQPTYSIYYRRDNLISAYWQKHAPRLEPLLCKKSDLVVANSIQLAEAVLPYNPKSFDIGQGLNLSQYNHWKLIPFHNTAISAKLIKDLGDKSKAAIASKKAAEVYGLKIIKENINNQEDNFTRFVVISRTLAVVPDADKVSVVFSLENEAGTLYRLLRHFAENNINMIKIESRPMNDNSWKYFLYVDFEGTLENYQVKKALKLIEANSEYFKLLGAYKTAIK